MDIQIFTPMQMDACLCFFFGCFRFTCMRIFTSSQNQHMPRYAGQEWELVFNQDSSPHTLWGAVHCRCSRSLALWSRSFALGKEVVHNGTTRWKCKLLPGLPGCTPTRFARFYQVLPGSTRVHQVTKAFAKLVLKEVPLWDGSRSEVGRLRICISKSGPKTGLMNLAGSQIVSGAGKTRHHWLDDYMGDSHGIVSNS